MGRPQINLHAKAQIMIKESGGDWIQLLDEEDWLDENKIKFQLEYFCKTADNAGGDIVLYSDYHVVTVDLHQ